MKIEELQVLISANADQFTGELVKVQNQLKQLNTSTQGIGKATGKNLFASMTKAGVVANVLTSAITGVAKGVASMTKDIVSGGSALARLRVANSAVATNLGMTGEQIQSLRDDLADANTYGIKAENIISSLALSGLMDLSKSLSFVDARSGETETGVTALTLAIKDLSAARGIDSDLGIERVSKFIQSGRTELVEGIIEIGNLTDEYQLFANSVNKSAGDLTAQEKAMVRMNVTMREAQKSFGAYALTYNTSGKIFSSIGMILTSIKEEIGSRIEPVLRTGGMAILEFFRGIQEAVMGSGTTIQDVSNKIAGYMVALVRIIGKIGSNIPFLGAGFKKLADFTLKPIQTQKSLNSSLGNTSGAMKDTSDSAKDLKKELAGLAGFDEMNVLKPAEDAGSAGSASIGGIDTSAVDSGLSGIEDTTEAIMGYAKKIEEFFTRIFTTVKEKIKEFTQPIVDFYNKYLKPILEFWWTMIENQIKPALERLGAVFSELFTSIFGKGTPTIDIFKTIAEVIGILIVGAVTAVIWIIARVIDIITGLVAITKWVVDGMMSSWNSFIDMLANIILWFREAGNKITNFWNNLKQGARDAWDTIKNVFGTVASWFGSIFGNAWNKVKAIFSAGGSVFQGIKDGISSAFRGIVNSLIRGINNVVSVPFNAINNMLSKLRGTSIAGLRPFSWLPWISTPYIPYLAQGGVVSSPTLSMIGEAGREAVIPLDRNTEWMEEIAHKISDFGGGGGGQPLIIKIGEETIYDGMIDFMKKKGLRTGTNILSL